MPAGTCSTFTGIFCCKKHDPLTFLAPFLLENNALCSYQSNILLKEELLSALEDTQPAVTFTGKSNGFIDFTSVTYVKSTGGNIKDGSNSEQLCLTDTELVEKKDQFF